MAKYICSYCAQRTEAPNSGSCSRSPNSAKNHEWINAEGKTRFVCSYCGQQTEVPNSGSCSRSPNSAKNHRWV